jgi:F0F1-type ATP synthase assembly protein I
MPRDGQGSSSWMKYSGVGFGFVGGVAGFGLIGYWIDNHYHSSPWGVLVGVALGLIGATYNLIRDSQAAEREARAEDRASKRKIDSP